MSLPNLINIVLVIFMTLFFTEYAFSNSVYKEEKLDFSHGDNRLSGFLILPKKGAKPFPVLLFVHGDGATSYDASDYYSYLWKQLAKNGIASYSWNKAGVEPSKGNWLNQSMEDRADEVIEAIKMLKQRTDIAVNKIGLIGFSQGGWVLPLVAKKSSYPDFMILVSGAINWLDQGDYLTTNRLRDKEYSPTQIQQALRCNKLGLQVLQPSSSYKEYLQYHNNLPPKCKPFKEEQMSPERFEFVKLNVGSDAKEGLATIQVPTLAVFGDKDKNVDFAESIREYKRIFKQSGNPNLTIKTFPNAEHSLFKTEYVDDVSPSMLTLLIKMNLLGENILAEGYLDFVTTWVKEITQSQNMNTTNSNNQQGKLK